MNAKQRITTLLTAAALSAGVVQATLLVVDDFESFNTGTLSGNGWTVDGTGYGDSTAEIQAVGLDYSNGDISFSGGNRSLILTLPNYGSTDATVDFINKSFTPQTGGTDSTVYFRYTFRQVVDTARFLNIGMSGDSDAAMSSRTSSAAVVLRSPDQYRAWDNAGGNTTSNADFELDTVHLIIGRVAFNESGNETVSFTLNPNNLTEGSNTWTTISNRDLGVTSFDTFGVFANRQGNGTLELDNIAVANSWDAIAIPEPGTIVLVGIALGSLLLFRRRRR